MSDLSKSEFIKLIRYPLLTSKATELIERENVYSFIVDKSATKNEITNAIEEIFNVKPVSVNTAVLPRKQRRVGKNIGFLPKQKKAFVKLSKEESISFLTED